MQLCSMTLKKLLERIVTERSHGLLLLDTNDFWPHGLLKETHQVDQVTELKFADLSYLNGITLFIQ